MPEAGWNLPAGHALQTLSLSAAATVPAEQAVGCVAPVGHTDPAGQAWQSPGAVAPVLLRKLPAAQSSAALAPSEQNEPSGQVSQAVAPTAAWYDPAGQGEQTPCAAVAAKVPAPQMLGSDAPEAHACPAGQGSHSA